MGFGLVRVWMVMVVVMVGAGVRVGWAEEVRWEMNLHGALFGKDGPTVDGPTLMLDVRKNGEAWERAWGIAGDFGKNCHVGYITRGEVTAEGMELSMDLNARRDAWAAGGYGEYVIKLKKTGETEYAGEFTGVFKGVEVKGKADARRLPSAKVYGERVAAGEHPRLLFRKGDLAGLREKAKTPFGKAAMERIEAQAGKGDLVAMGVMYQMTGEKRWAEEAVPVVEKRIKEGLVSDQFGNNVGERAMAVAIAYDCMYEAWSPAFRAKVEGYFLYVVHSIHFSQSAMNTSINWHVASNWSAPLYMGAAYGALAMWGDAGPMPEKPVAPVPMVEAGAARGYVVPEGVPRSKLVSDQMPGEWIYAGGFTAEDRKGGDPLGAMGGAGKARPELGTKLKAGAREDVFRVLSHEKDKGYYRIKEGPEQIDITNAIGRIYHSRSYVYTVVENEEAGWYRVGLSFGGAEMFLNGVGRRDGEYVKLEAGVYPMLVVIDIAQTNPWGRDLIQPRLIRATEEEAKAYAAKEETRHGEQVKIWEHEVAIWKGNGGRDAEKDRAFESSRRMVYAHYREAVGDGGFQAEVSHYSAIATGTAMRYAPAYRVAMGEDVSPLPDITHHVPQKLFNHLFLEGRKPIAQEINGQVDVDGRMYAYAFSITPEEWKPVVLWAWLREMAENRKGGEKAGAGGELELLLDADAVRAFLYVPVGMEPKGPKGLMPLTWKAGGFGYAGFRNGWEGETDVLFQVFARSNAIGGWNGPNAGTFRLAGFGTVWAYGPTDRNRSRWEENVVWLPDDTINLNAQGRVTHLVQEKDGGGSVSIDMNDVYAGRVEKKGLYQRSGSFRKASGFADSGITGLRAMAVDYSGKGGAPAVLILVDRIEGGGKKVWAWQLGKADAKTKVGDLQKTTVEGATFTVKKNDAVLKGTFVSPAKVKVSAESKQFTMLGGAGSSAGKVLSRPVDGVFAESDEERVDIICVVTLGKGEPPVVKGEERDGKWVIRVGGREAVWDGKVVAWVK